MPRHTLSAVIAAHARSTPAVSAVLAPGRDPLSYGALQRQIGSTAEALAVRGLGAGSRIGLALRNGPESVVALLAVISCATCVPLNPRSDEQTLRSLCGQLRIDALIVAENGPAIVLRVARELGIPILTLVVSGLEPAGTFTLHGETGNEPVVATAAEPDDLALVLHTSGTTGRAKAVPLTHRSQYEATIERVRMFQLTARDRSICIAPSFTSAAIKRSIFWPLAAGGSIVCPSAIDGERLLEWLSAFKPTIYGASPAVHREVLGAVFRRGSPPPHALRYVFSGATALPSELRSRLEEVFGVPVIQTYAVTEAGTVTQDPLSPALRRAGSVGLPAGAEVAILRDDGEFCPAGESGEVVVRGPEVFSGYEDDPEANRRAFCGDWFRTGDFGFMDPDGYLYLTGRLKEVINRGGLKVPPGEVDAVLMRHPAVADAATFGIAHPTLGEDVISAVILREGTGATTQELRDSVFDALAAFKVPSRIVPVSSIPKTPLGKVRRRELADMLAAALEPAYDAPRDPREARVAEIFAEVLGIARVGSLDNFFALGGDSLRAAQTTTRVNVVFGCQLDAASLFRRPTVAEFAAEIAANRHESGAILAPPIVRLPRRDEARPNDDDRFEG